MQNQSLWFNVLTHFDRKGYFSNGLTIPFLLGANSVINQDEEMITVEDFFSEIIDLELPIKISIQRCGNIGEYVIGIFDNDSPSEYYRNFGNLYITDNSFSNISDEEEIRKILVEEYQDKLDEGLFSIHHRDWGDYSETDRNHLEELR